MLNVVTGMGNEIDIGKMLLEMEPWFRILSAYVRSCGMNWKSLSVELKGIKGAKVLVALESITGGHN
jgi:hypothetical protein